MLCRPGKLGSGSIISIKPNSCGPSARQHRDASNPHGHPAPWNGEPSGRNRAEPRPLPKKPSRRDRWFESCSLQRGVWCEPGFWGRVPSMTAGTWRRVTDAATPRREGSGNVPVLPFLGLQRIKLMPAPRPVRWIGEGYASPLPAHRSFEIAAFKGITAQDPMATEKP